MSTCPTDDRLILFNANIITMDTAMPRAELIAISGDRIAAVGDNSLLERLRQPHSRIIDCQRKVLLPGFIDAHGHLQAYAESLVSLNLSPQADVRSIADIQSRIRERCARLSPGTWIRGKGYNEFYLAEGRHPNRRDLDSAAPNHPVKLTHRSGHAHVLNSAALELAGITEETGDPPEGFIDRDPETGMPTGILYGMGEYLAGKVSPLDVLEMERGLVLANEKLLSYGITSIHDVSSGNDPGTLSRLEGWKARGVFQPRAMAALGWKAFRELRQNSRPDSAHAPAGVKIIADQVTGTLHPSQEELSEEISAIHEAGLQAIVHAVEEPVIEAVCNAVSYALQQHPRKDPRHRVEHCSVCPPSLIERLTNLGVTVVTQPSFIYYSGERYLKTVPQDQLGILYPIGSMLAGGLSVAFGSDFPIVNPNPLVGIGTAVTRATEGGGTLFSHQAIPVSNALEMYTMGAAAASFQERVKGSITPGKLADIIMLDQDPFEVDSACIKDIQVRMTILGGRIVWENHGTSRI